MELVLIVIYILTNILLIVYYFRKPLGAFQAPLILACISLTVILPQLTTIYVNPYYPKDVIRILAYVMISSNIFFAVGFNLGTKKKVPRYLKDIQLEKTEYLALAFACIGVTSIYFYSGNLDETVDRVIASNIKNFAHLALSLSLVCILKGFRTKLIYLCAFIAIATIVNFAFFVKASRGDSLVLFLNLLLFLSLFRPKNRKTIEVSLLCFLLLGSIISASISQYRTALVGKESTGSVTDIDYLSNFESAFSNSHTEVGMDLGNAALGIDYCYLNNSYDYGFKVWNEFVFYFVPRRLVGDDVKSNMYFKAAYQDIIPRLTYNITTMTGYFDAFSAFSFFAFLFFMVIGYILGLFWNYASYSEYYKFLYFFVFTQVPLMVTISTQILFFKLEIVLLFLYPFFKFCTYKKNLLKEYLESKKS